MKSAIFALEGMKGVPGLTDGTTWNGWSNPLFTYKQACEVMEQMNAAAENDQLLYNSVRDAFVYYDEGGDSDDFKAQLIDGKKYYAIGNNGWCWKEVTKKKKHQAWTPDSAQVFGEHAWAYLPGHLSKRKMTVQQLQELKLVDHPDILKGLLLATVKRLFPNDTKRTAKIRNDCKLYGCRSREQARRIFRLSDVSETELRTTIRELVEDNGLYDTAEGVKAKKSSSFEYSDEHDRKYHDEQHKVVECPSCGHEETVYCEGSEHIETIENWMQDFKHVTGPYVRCSECDKVVRPTVKECDYAPNFEGDSERWNDHVEFMGELAERLAGHAVAKGLPKPSHLMLTASGIDWRNRTGWRVIKLDGKELADAMTVNSDFMLTNGELWLEPEGHGQISCRMYHHDAPTGGSITAMPAWECDMLDSNRYASEDDFIVGEDIFKAAVFGKVATVMLCGEGEAFSYTSSHEFGPVALSNLVEALKEQQPGYLEDTPSTFTEAYQEMLNEQYEELIDRLQNTTNGMPAYEQALAVRKYLDLYLAELEKPEENNVVIIMDGGAITEILSSQEGVSVMVADEDTEGADEGSVYRLKALQNKERYIIVHDTTPDAVYVSKVFDQHSKADPAFAGTVSHATLRPQDLVPTFLQCLKERNTRTDFVDLMNELTADGYEDALKDDDHAFWNASAHLVDRLIDRLNETAPEGFYFGAHPGDGSDFGFWRNEEESV